MNITKSRFREILRGPQTFRSKREKRVYWSRRAEGRCTA